MRRFLPSTRFSLRVLLVAVALLCVGLAREVHTVQERREMLKLVDPLTTDENGKILKLFGVSSKDPRNWLRKQLRDPVEYGRAFPQTMPELRERYAQVFPESHAPFYEPLPEPEPVVFDGRFPYGGIEVIHLPTRDSN